MILLQILDEGTITDSQGRKVDFKVCSIWLFFYIGMITIMGLLFILQNTIICLTSNLGSDILAHPTASEPETGVVTPQAKSEVIERTEEYFPPELLNRLDSILVFNKLSKPSILKVVDLRLNDVAERLKNRRITLDMDQPARDWLAQHGYSDLYGARAIARVVRTDVLFPLACKLLRGTIRDGDTVKIRVDGEGLEILENHLEEPTVAKPELEVNHVE